MHIMRLALSLVAVALLAGPALAQRQPRQQGSLLANKSVQEELKLSEDQVKKATEVEKTINDKRQEEMGKLSAEERRGDKGRELRQKFASELNAELSKVLKPEQQMRYKQIQFQQSVSRAITGAGGRRPGGGGGGGMQRAFYEISTVADAMKFSDDQKEKLKALNDEAKKAIMKAREDAGDDRAKAREATTKILKETLDSVKKVLTAEQKKKWEELSGKPFTLRVERPGTSL
jgi:hypothetical protein